MKNISERTAQNRLFTLAAGIGTIAFSCLALVNSEPVFWGLAIYSLAGVIYCRWRASRPESLFVKEEAEKKQPRARWRLALDYTALLGFFIWGEFYRPELSVFCLGLLALIIVINFGGIRSKVSALI